VACTGLSPDDPVQIIDLSSQLQADVPASTDVHPWLIELSNGDQCSPYSGAMAPIAGEYPSYGCGGVNGFDVLGDIDMSTPVWTVQLNSAKSATLTTGTVVKARN